MKICRSSVFFCVLGWAAIALPLRAGLIPLPNSSFESPSVVFVDTNIESWQKGPTPPWYVEEGGFLWSQLSGIFKNAAPGKADHLVNCDRDQAIWLFAVPEVSLFQDHGSMDWNDPEPSGAFSARFAVGKSYSLAVAVNGGGGGMKPGVTLLASLYFRDALSNRVTVASTTITNSIEAFPNRTHLTDFLVHTPVVKSTDPWASMHIGFQLLSTVDVELQGGYWDIDNVRLNEREAPVLSNVSVDRAQVSFSIRSDAGSLVEILATPDIGAPRTSWVAVATLTNTSGSIDFIDPVRTERQRFYQARRLD